MFSANLTFSKVILVNAIQSGFYLLKFNLPVSFRFQRHRLKLDSNYS